VVDYIEYFFSDRIFRIFRIFFVVFFSFRLRPGGKERKKTIASPSLMQAKSPGQVGEGASGLSNLDTIIFQKRLLVNQTFL